MGASACLPVAAGLGLGDVGRTIQHGRRGRGSGCPARLGTLPPGCSPSFAVGDGNESRWETLWDELRVPGDRWDDPEEIVPGEAEGAGLAQDENRLIFGTVE